MGDLVITVDPTQAYQPMQRAGARPAFLTVGDRDSVLKADGCTLG